MPSPTATIILDGRGWSNKDRNSAYDKLDGDQLFECLGSWSPVVRERAAMASARRKGGSPVPALVKLLDSPRLESRYRACEALLMLKAAAAPAVPALSGLLGHQDLWLRVKAADALAAIGKPAMSTVPVLLERLAKPPTKEDPRGMELCLDVMEIDKWGKADRIDRCPKALATYRGAAKPLLPRLRQLEKDLTAHGEAKNLKPKIDILRSLIQDIENTTENVELRSLE